MCISNLKENERFCLLRNTVSYSTIITQRNTKQLKQRTIEWHKPEFLRS